MFYNIRLMIFILLNIFICCYGYMRKFDKVDDIDMKLWVFINLNRYYNLSQIKWKYYFNAIIRGAGKIGPCKRFETDIWGFCFTDDCVELLNKPPYPNMEEWRPVDIHIDHFIH